LQRLIAEPVASSTKSGLVAFDFDGTLTWRDSFVDFLVWRAGRFGFAARLPALVPAALAYGIHRDRGILKAAFARRFFGGVSRAQLQEDAQRFAAARFDVLIRPDALACWGNWRERGARLYIVTASPDIIVAPFAARLGADGLIATRLAFDTGGHFAGALQGPNCRGEEKAVRLRGALGPDVRLTAAYGDTAGDREMLALAEHPGLRVFSARPREDR
jgi:phosphatidylglycerophosphatase C